MRGLAPGRRARRGSRTRWRARACAARDPRSRGPSRDWNGREREDHRRPGDRQGPSGRSGRRGHRVQPSGVLVSPNDIGERSREAGASPARSRRCEGRRSSPRGHWPRPGRRRGGSPESEDLPLAPNRSPRGRRKRASRLLAIAQWPSSPCSSWPSPALAEGSRARRGGHVDHLRGAQSRCVTPCTGSIRPPSGETLDLNDPTPRRAGAREPAGEFFYGSRRRSFGPYVSQIGRLPPRETTAGCTRSTASRRPSARPTTRQGGGRGAVVLRPVRPERRAADARLVRRRQRVLRGVRARTTRARPPRSGTWRFASNGRRVASRVRPDLPGRPLASSRVYEARLRPVGRPRRNRRPVAHAPLPAAARCVRARRPASPRAGRRRTSRRATAGGDAQLWVTRDNGTEVVLEAAVPSGISAIAALDGEADIETRYGGRFVQAVDGVEGSLPSSATGSTS